VTATPDVRELPWGRQGLRPPGWLERLRRWVGAQATFGGGEDEPDPWVTVYWATGYEEAYIVRGALEAEGIPALLSAESAVYGSTALAGVKVRVPLPLEDRAREVLGT
jgi:hypothetical protein